MRPIVGGASDDGESSNPSTRPRASSARRSAKPQRTIHWTRGTSTARRAASPCARRWASRLSTVLAPTASVDATREPSARARPLGHVARFGFDSRRVAWVVVVAGRQNRSRRGMGARRRTGGKFTSRTVGRTSSTCARGGEPGGLRVKMRADRSASGAQGGELRSDFARLPRLESSASRVAASEGCRIINTPR